MPKTSKKTTKVRKDIPDNVEKAVDQVMALVDEIQGTIEDKEDARMFYQGVYAALNIREDSLGD